jgi:hypothetical protein
VRDIAEMVRDAVPSSTVSLADTAGPDLRNYRMDFSKLAGTFPGLRLRWSVRDRTDEFARACSKRGLTCEDYLSSRFVRLRRNRRLLSAGIINEMLRRQASEHLSAADAEITQRG